MNTPGVNTPGFHPRMQDGRVEDFHFSPSCREREQLLARQDNSGCLRIFSIMSMKFCRKKLGGACMPGNSRDHQACNQHGQRKAEMESLRRRTPFAAAITC